MENESSILVYFVITVIILFLIPGTLYTVKSLFFHKIKTPVHICNCSPCKKKASKSNSNVSFKRHFLTVIILSGWVGVVLLGRGASSLETKTAFDPFHLLNLEIGASPKEIKDAYRHLSYVHHPDRGGNAEQFMEIAKAYKTLMDSEAHENWEKYGNPDGPTVLEVGTALPRWLTQRENRFAIFCIYLIILFVGVPIVLVVYWRRTKVDGRLLEDTEQLFGYFVHKHPEMNAERIMVCLSAAFEFDPFHGSDISVRITDARDMPALLKLIPRAQSYQGENIFKHPYSIKARALMYSHLQRMPVTPNLSTDRDIVITKCPRLLSELIKIIMTFVSMAHVGHVPHEPSITTLDNTIRLSALITQSLAFEDSFLSPFLQLPFIDVNRAKKIVSRKKIPVRSLGDLVSLDYGSVRAVMDFLVDSEFTTCYDVLGCMPRVDVGCSVFVDGSDNDLVTPGCCVSFDVFLTRGNMLDHVDSKIEQVDGRIEQVRSVHCPLFPEFVGESWSVYVSDGRHLMTPCVIVSDLLYERKVELRMTAPERVGKYEFVVCVRSMCYLGVDSTVKINIAVSKLPEETMLVQSISSTDSDY